MKMMPERTCIGCHIKKNKNELIRIVKNKNGEINVDIKNKLDGRGFYICKSLECLEKIKKNKKICKNFKPEILGKIRNEIIGGEIIG